MILTPVELATFTEARNACPHDFLGMRPFKKGRSQGLLVRAFIREAKACEVVDLANKSEPAYEMELLAPEGFFEVFIPKRKDVFRYQLRATLHSGEIRQFFDPYSFLPTLASRIFISSTRATSTASTRSSARTWRRAMVSRAPSLRCGRRTRAMWP